MKNMANKILERIEQLDTWETPMLPENIPHGDMPGGKIQVTKEYIEKADKIFPELLRQIKETVIQKQTERIVMTVCGGSGVGKSTIASLLSFYLNRLGISSYVLSGDNYPHRIPKYNDAERLRLFREAGLKKMIRDGEYTPERFQKIQEWQRKGIDASAIHAEQYPWFASYLIGGRKELENYLGSSREIGFDEVKCIVKQFKDGASAIWLKRMGREEEELWYEQVDFSGIYVLNIDWSHGNSDYYQGVDIPVFLNSTPLETLECRLARNRDCDADSPFTAMVLEIEQELLKHQAHKAKIIFSKQGRILSFDEFRKLTMKDTEGETL